MLFSASNIKMTILLYANERCNLILKLMRKYIGDQCKYFKKLTEIYDI